jgi:hypothetical protein
MVEFSGIGLQAKHGFTQAFPMRQLAEGHTEILLPTGEIPDFIISKMLIYNSLELLLTNQPHNLGEDISALIHN